MWDIKGKEKDPKLFERGYEKGLTDTFEIGAQIGKGGFGLVRVVKEKSTGTEYACKSIKKALEIPNISEDKQFQHLDNIDREIKVLKLLRGTLSVVYLRGVWEDEEDIHIVMEHCQGGELYHGVGRQPYTEETVSIYMRSVLQTISQCHSHRILHRDIKPGNFLLLTKDKYSPLKAIDFGLAAFYDPQKLPRTDLGLDGTPWFMAPEVLNSETYPASDVWSAGIMCYQLLSGFLPFDDTRNRSSPSLSLVWRAILTEEVSFSKSAWQNVSQVAKDFVKTLLNKDPLKRISAKQALDHPWLQSSFHKNNTRTLDSTVVQRIQRFSQLDILRRTILELIAAELIKLRPPTLPDPTVRGGATLGSPGSDTALSSTENSSIGEDSAHGGMVFPMSPESRVSGKSKRLNHSVSLGRMTEGMSVTQDHPSNIIPDSKGWVGKLPVISKRADPNSTKAATIHGGREYWRALRQASNLVTQGSAHGSCNYLRAMSLSEKERGEQRKAARLSLDTSVHGGKAISYERRPLEFHNEELMATKPMPQRSPPRPPPIFSDIKESPESGYHKRKLEESLETGGRGRSAALEALQAAKVEPGSSDQMDISSQGEDNAHQNLDIIDPTDLESIMKDLRFRKGTALDKDSLAKGLHTLGYDIQPDEVGQLMEQLDLNSDSKLGASEFVASQLDWPTLQKNNKEIWLESAKRAFDDLDASSRGHISAGKIIAALRKKLPDDEIDFAVEDALVESGIADPEQIDFENFLQMARFGSLESLPSLEQYDPRLHVDR